MSYLLFPGRHLVNTTFQERYLKRVLTALPASVAGFISGRASLAKPPTEILFAITSANQENSRFNPIPFHIRAVGVDRFARQLQALDQSRWGEVTDEPARGDARPTGSASSATTQLPGRPKFRYRVFGIPHYGHTKNFAAFTTKEIACQSEAALQLAPENCLVLCSTSEVIRLYQELGFSVVPAELAEGEPRPATPIEITSMRSSFNSARAGVL